MKTEIIIYGKGDLAKLIFYYLNTDSDYKVVAFCVDKDYLDSESFLGLPLISIDNIEKYYPPKNYKSLVTVGYKNMRARKEMFLRMKSKGYSFINYISSNSIVSNNVRFGENNIILDGCIIEPFVEIANNNILWSSVTVCHNVKIHSHCFIASRTLIGGFSEIKDNCFLGFDSTIIQNIVIEEETLVGAKSLILKNTKKSTKYIGIPAKEVSKHGDFWGVN